MTIIASIMQPQIPQLRAPSPAPRLLAYGLLILAECDNHDADFQQAFDTTHERIATMGATISATKSYAFSTNRKTPQRLRFHNLVHLDGTMLVLTSTRDLCSLVNTRNGG